MWTIESTLLVTLFFCQLCTNYSFFLLKYPELCYHEPAPPSILFCKHFMAFSQIFFQLLRSTPCVVICCRNYEVTVDLLCHHRWQQKPGVIELGFCCRAGAWLLGTIRFWLRQSAHSQKCYSRNMDFKISKIYL